MNSSSNINKGYFYTGDEYTINYFFDNFFASACVFAKSMINNDQEAYDIVQNTFIKLWDRNLKFESVIQFKAYLYITVKNNCLNYSKKQKPIHKQPIEKTENSVEDILIQTEIEAELIKHINKLPETKKEIILLRLSGMTLGDISEKLEISQNTVKTHIRLANKELKASLKDLYFIFLYLF